MRNAMRCTSVLILSALIVLPWQRVGVTVADDVAPAPVVSVAPVVMEPSCYEDQPCWNCRTMGNMRCGVFIHGDRYIVQFVAGRPVSITSAD